MCIRDSSDYWNNIGRIRNSGIEIELNTHNIRTKAVSYTHLEADDTHLRPHMADTLGGRRRT